MTPAGGVMLGAVFPAFPHAQKPTPTSQTNVDSNIGLRMVDPPDSLPVYVFLAAAGNVVGILHADSDGVPLAVFLMIVRISEESVAT